jgi:glyoxylase-like metal-dependent hydrolase (beta-lactamase superfamily II)
MNSRTLMAVAVTATAFSLSACASSQNRRLATNSRIIEFKSGPEGFDTRSFFYEGAQEVVAIDAQFTPELARQSIKHLRTYTDKPISWLVITHPNPDKFNGASVFKAEGAKIVASQRTIEAIEGVHAYKKYYFVKMAKMFTNENYPSPVPVDESFGDRLTLNLKGGERMELTELGRPGISSNQTVVWVPATKALFVGDLVHHKVHAWLEGGIVNGQPKPELASWIAVLNDLKRSYPANTQVLGGRGDTANLSDAVALQVTYLTNARKIVRDYIVSLGQRTGELSNENAGQHYKALAQAFERTFPRYTLPYMIEYGVYGLVNAELAKLKK